METKDEKDIPITSGKKTSSLSSLHPLSEAEQLFDRILGRRWPSLMRWHDLPLLSGRFEDIGLRMPNVDVIDRDDEIAVRAEVPGIDKKDLDISLSDNILTIKGQTQTEKKEEKGDYHRHEISSSSFARSVTLPAAVDASKANAALKDGVLEITLPKLESCKRRNISVA
ncbi:MAG: Hsp20/alpha crystallin family protein [Methylophilaceae bacterium]|jgi:HSP20 family protein